MTAPRAARPADPFAALLDLPGV
ncbi:MAG: hypothetical protein JWN55_1799, partial [Frankiales bacterium]|nr:hypothetical protein [Frankiales bacterium]